MCLTCDSSPLRVNDLVLVCPSVGMGGMSLPVRNVVQDTNRNPVVLDTAGTIRLWMVCYFEQMQYTTIENTMIE